MGTDRARYAGDQAFGPAARDRVAQGARCDLVYRAQRLSVADAAEGLPPFTTVQGYFYDWRDDGLFEKINFALLLRAIEAIHQLSEFIKVPTCVTPTVSTCVTPSPSWVTGPSRSSNMPPMLPAFNCCHGDGL